MASGPCVSPARMERSAPFDNKRGDPNVTQSIDFRRRGILRASGVSLLSASAVALLAGCEKMAAAKSDAEVGKALNAAALKNQADVLRLAQRLEKGAANAYIGVIPSFGDRALAQVSARLAADEVMHWTVLSQALKEPLPAKALSFGA